MKTENQPLYLTAESIYRFITDQDEELDTLVLCRSSEIQLMTTDQSLYEAVGSVEERDDINFSKLIKLLEVSKITHFPELLRHPRKILTEERAKEIRNNKGGNQNDR